jgi:hypothetical protein
MLTLLTTGGPLYLSVGQTPATVQANIEALLHSAPGTLSAWTLIDGGTAQIVSDQIIGFIQR